LGGTEIFTAVLHTITKNWKQAMSSLGTIGKNWEQFRYSQQVMEKQKVDGILFSHEEKLTTNTNHKMS
jgi:hypothetical protein